MSDKTTKWSLRCLPKRSCQKYCPPTEAVLKKRKKRKTLQKAKKEQKPKAENCLDDF